MLKINSAGETIYDESVNSNREFKKFRAKILSVLKTNIEIDLSLKKNMEISLYFKEDFLNCSCPKIIPNKNYLIIIKSQDLMKYSTNKNFSFDFASSFSNNNLNSDSMIKFNEDWVVQKNFEIREWKLKNFKRVKRFLNRRCNKLIN